MRIVIAGAHGQVARRLGRLLSAPRRHRRRHRPQSRHDRATLAADGARHPSSSTSRRATVDDVAAARRRRRRRRLRRRRRTGQRRRARKDTVDRAAAVLLADAAERAGGPAATCWCPPMGVESVADGRTPEGMDDVFVAYLRAKLAAEEDVLRPRPALDDDGRCGPAASPTTRAPAGSRSARHVPSGRSPGTTSPRCCSPCWTPPRPAAVLEVVAGSTPRSRRRCGALSGQARRARVTSVRAASSVVGRVVDRAPGSARPAGATGTSLARSVRANSPAGHSAGRRPSPDREQRADEAADHRVAERVGRRARSRSGRRSGRRRARAACGSSSRPRGGGRRRRSRARPSSSAAASGHRVGVQRPRPADGVGPAQRRRPARGVGEPVDVVPRQRAEPGVEVRDAPRSTAGTAMSGGSTPAQPADQPVAPAPPTARRGTSQCATCPVACTPASVRPATVRSTGTRRTVRQRLLEVALHGALAGLPRPAVQSRCRRRRRPDEDGRARHRCRWRARPGACGVLSGLTWGRAQTRRRER